MDMRRTRMESPAPPVAVKADDAQLRQFRRYARVLAARYPALQSGMDGQDVEQTALVAAWQAIPKYDGSSRFVPFVQQRMRWAVIEFVRARTLAEQEDVRRMPLNEP